jgi:hypothetical protein
MTNTIQAVVSIYIVFRLVETTISAMLAGWPLLSRSEGAEMFSRRCQFSKGGVLTFAYRSKFFANSYFRASRPAFFHHTFLVPSSQTRNRNRAIIHRRYSIENRARLQRRTHPPPQNILAAL